METFLSVFKEKEAKRFKLKAGVLLVIIQSDEVLLSRRFQTGIDDGMYVVPMGGHDGEEPLSEAVIREAQEECNIELTVDDIELCHTMHRLHHMPHNLSFEQMDFFFRIKGYKGFIHNNEPHRCDDLSFYPLSNLPTNIAPCIRHGLECVQKGIVYSEFGFNANTS